MLCWHEHTTTITRTGRDEKIISYRYGYRSVFVRQPAG
nr:MAG TPA_asm: hypothetical protein [Caudoviricetes sp.]